MTIHRSHGQVEFHCDGLGCHSILEAETRDFEEARAVFHNENWTLRRDGNGSFLHVCPDCLEAERPAL